MMNIRAQQGQPLERLSALLRGVPAVEALRIKSGHRAKDNGTDALAEIKLKGVSHWHRWLIEVKSRPLEPREAEFLALQLREYRSGCGADYARGKRHLRIRSFRIHLQG